MPDRELLRRLSRPTKVSILAVEARAGTLSSSDLAALLDILAAGPTEKTGLARSAIEACALEGMPGGRLADLRAAFGITDSVRFPAVQRTPVPAAPAVPAVPGRPARSSVLDTRAVKLAFRTQFEEAVAVSQARSGASAGAAAGASGALRRVLVADEDRAARAALREELQNAGFYVFEASEGHEAWQRIETPGIDALIMDMKLPGMSGVELLARLNAAGRALPVVVCTAAVALQSEFAVATYPRLRFLAKPAPAGAVAEALKELLARKG